MGSHLSAKSANLMDDVRRVAGKRMVSRSYSLGGGDAAVAVAQIAPKRIDTSEMTQRVARASELAAATSVPSPSPSPSSSSSLTTTEVGAAKEAKSEPLDYEVAIDFSSTMSSNNSGSTKNDTSSAESAQNSGNKENNSGRSGVVRITTGIKKTKLAVAAEKEAEKQENSGWAMRPANGRSQAICKRKNNERHEFTVSWRNLDFVVESNWLKMSSERKLILNDISGSFKSGELSAVLGPSGAGKSTLIDCLIGKRKRGLSGQTRVALCSSLAHERERRSKGPLKISLIPQKDHLLDSLTVTETFMFASKIKNAHLTYMEDGDRNIHIKEDGRKQKRAKGRKLSDHLANVKRVIDQLNLTSCANVRCGKLSGGQYKRVSIGQELLSRPDLMILDEPTSGLDSATCYQTISALRHLIDSSPYPIAIVANIHQPDIEVFNLFHKAYVLASGGRAIFEGPTEAIFDQIQSGLELVEARREIRSMVAPMWSSQKDQKLPAAASLNSDDINGQQANIKQEQNCYAGDKEHLAELRRQLGQRSSNPARLIVQVAAFEYGYEITGAMNDIHRAGYRHEGGGGGDGKNSPTHSSLVSSRMNLGSSASARYDETTTILPESSKWGQQGTLSAPPYFDYEANSPRRKKRADLDMLLSSFGGLNNGKQGASSRVRVYLRHFAYLTQRSWKTTVRDPMLALVQISLHILVPILISYAFSRQADIKDACPDVGPLDFIEEAYGSGDALQNASTQVRTSFENLGYMFFQSYVIIFAAICGTSLTYPLEMHVLIKEHRNGWYSLSSYFLGRTLADLPLPIFNATLALGISYHLTGQPTSPYAWRFLSSAGIVVLATLVAQTHGLLFGALLMNSPQTAVFAAPVSTAPLVVFSGFLLRIKSLPGPLQLISKLSYFTYMLNGFVISRYGFNRCPCDDSKFQSLPSDHEIPNQVKVLIDLWVESFAFERNEYLSENLATSALSTLPSNGTLATTAAVLANQTTTTTASTPKAEVDLIGKLIDTISGAKSYGFELKNCNQVKPFTMLDYELEDSDLYLCFGALVLMLLLFRWLAYLSLSWKISSSI